MELREWIVNETELNFDPTKKLKILITVCSENSMKGFLEIYTVN